MAFDKEGVQEYLNTEEGKNWFTSMANAMGFKSTEEVEKEKEGVVNKYQEVIRDNKKLQNEIKELEGGVDKFGQLKEILKDYEIGIDDSGNFEYDKVEESLDKLRLPSNGSSNKLQENERLLKRFQRDLDQTKKEVADRDSQIATLETEVKRRESVISELLVDGAFHSSLIAAGYSELIIPNILPALRAKSHAQIQQDEETGRYKAITDDGRSIEDWVKIWKDTEEGKALRLSPENSGGGSRGSSGGAGVPKKLKEMTPGERVKLFKENPELYHKLKGA
nr:hypothetical protein 8 [bacterium]